MPLANALNSAAESETRLKGNPSVTEPEVELSDCIRCGVCEEACPEVFVIRDAGYVQVIELEEYPKNCVDEAIKNCPADCISWKY